MCFSKLRAINFIDAWSRMRGGLKTKEKYRPFPRHAEEDNNKSLDKEADAEGEGRSRHDGWWSRNYQCKSQDSNCRKESNHGTRLWAANRCFHVQLFTRTTMDECSVHEGGFMSWWSSDVNEPANFSFTFLSSQTLSFINWDQKIHIQIISEFISSHYYDIYRFPKLRSNSISNFEAIHKKKFHHKEAPKFDWNLRSHFDHHKLTWYFN